MGWETFQFGQVYLDGIPQCIPITPTVGGDIPNYKEDQIIEIMGAPKEHSITWVKPDGMNLFVADRVLLKNASWEDLETAGFVKGQTVYVGGRRYRCRLLQVGSIEDTPSEWDSILDATTENNDPWHWENIFFWGVDTAINRASHRAVRGYPSARYWDSGNATNRYVNVGFRPVIEPLPSETLDTDELITLDGQKFVISQLQGANGRMFYPQLSPIGRKPFADIADGTIVDMYTALADGKPVRTDLDNPASLADKVDVFITDKFYGKEFLIPWVISNGVAVASKPLLKT